MKIVQVTPRYAPHTGGVETHVQEISEQFVQLGHQVTVVTADLSDDTEPVERINSVDVLRHRGFAFEDSFHIAPGILSTIKKTEADVVHVHNYHSLPLFFAALGVDDERLIVTPHYHGASTDAIRDALLAAYRPIGRWALEKGDAVVAVSEWERERLHDDFSVEATVIPNGLNVGRFERATPETRDRPYLLFVGRLERYKGVQYVIRALNELPEYDLVVVGTGPHRETLERIAEREGVADRVDFLGFVENDRLPELYAGAEVFTTLSRFEAYGLTVSEALAAGTPCVVREAGALVEWTRKDGVAGVTDVEPSSVKVAVNSVVDHTPTVKIPTWSAVTEQLIEIYSEE